MRVFSFFSLYKEIPLEDSDMENGRVTDRDAKEWKGDTEALISPRSSPSRWHRTYQALVKTAARITLGGVVAVQVGGLLMVLMLVGYWALFSTALPKQTTTPKPEELNLSPIIGILSVELKPYMDEALQPHNYTSYIAASYVKFYESAGARVVPILINQDDEYYHNMASYINGMVFPGGAVSITNSSGYGRAGDLMFHLLQERDPPVPLIATCLGFEMLMYLAANRTYPGTYCEAKDRADPLYLAPGWEDSRLLGEAPADVLQTLTSTNATSNFHHKCVLPQTFQSLGISSDYRLLSTNVDAEGVEYVSTVEHKTLPFYGTQWHPEKNSFEWGFSSIPHTGPAIRAAQYIASIFIEQARLNHQSFPTPEEEQAALIYNYCALFTGNIYSSPFQQCYFFK